MRIGAAAVVGILLLGGSVKAQTADVQQMAEARLALARLGRGIRVPESIGVLAEDVLKGPIRDLQRSGEVLRRLLDGPAARAEGKPQGRAAP